MIKPVTFQGCVNFNANLYAVEVRSRFIDQTKANGYYRNYGEDIAASVIAQSIRIGTGVFLVQGRMAEITAAETVTPEIYDGFVGYVIAHIETYHPADERNVTLIARVNRTLDAIALTQNDIYANTADNVNMIYELPLYSFRISGTTITDVVKLIQPIEDYATVKKIADDALKQVQDAVKAAEKAAADAAIAAGQATAAGSAAKSAQDAAEQARADASEAARQAGGSAQTATDAANLAARTAQETEQAIERLEQQIGEKQGTTVRVDGAPLAEINLDEVIFIGGDATDEEV